MAFHNIYITDDLSDHLNQGDIFTKLSNPDFNYDFGPANIAFMILTYTCDFTNNKVYHVNFCPIYTIESLIVKLTETNQYKNESNALDSSKKFITQISQYNNSKFYFLPSHQNLNNKNSYANLELIQSIKYEKFKAEMLSNRILSLNSPWREKLGYLISYNYNRVALKDHNKSLLQDLYTNQLKEEYQKLIKDNE